MRACRQYQISHSHFLGGPPRWTEGDQDKAVAYEQYLAEPCPGCGTRAADWEEDPQAHVGHQYRCLGCEVLDQERKNVPEDEPGVHVVLIPREYAEMYARLEAEADKKRREQQG